MNPLDLITIGSKLIDRLIPDPQAKAAAQVELLRLQQAGEFKELEERMRAIVAEAQSTDPWTSRARPTFLYVMYIMILSALPAGIAFVFFPGQVEAAISGVKLWLAAIPSELYALFGAGYLGYTWQRGQEKQAAIKRGP